LTSFSISN